MPGAHRITDDRFCGGLTVEKGNSTVHVNGLLWAVEGDPNDHGAGDLIAVYGTKNVFVNNKKVICAIGDKAEPDNANHPAPPTDPKGSSNNVIVYGGGGGGG